MSKKLETAQCNFQLLFSPWTDCYKSLVNFLSLCTRHSVSLAFKQDDGRDAQQIGDLFEKRSLKTDGHGTMMGR